MYGLPDVLKELSSALVFPYTCIFKFNYIYYSSIFAMVRVNKIAIDRSKQRSSIMNRNRVRKFRVKKQMLKETNNGDHELFQESLQSQNTTDTNDASMFDSANGTNINCLLRSWVNCHAITTRAVNDLLGLLKSTGYYLPF